MSDLTTHWRPLGQIRTKSLAVIWRSDAILVCAIPDDAGNIKGWRPLGGTVEFGERAEVTVVRELSEEIDATSQVTRQIGVVQNLYEHQGVTGHEIAFLFDVSLIDPGQAEADTFVVDDEGTRFACEWIAINRFRSGELQLFPAGLLPLL